MKETVSMKAAGDGLAVFVLKMKRAFRLYIYAHGSGRIDDFKGYARHGKGQNVVPTSVSSREAN